jgi:PAS domain S-box-containing protein
VGLVLVLTIAGSLLARGLAERDARSDSDRRVELAAALISSRISEATSLATSLRRFISTEGAAGVTNDQFAQVALRWLDPAEVPAAAWVEEIPAGKRADYERRLGHAIVTPEQLHKPERPRSSYLAATLVSGFPPIDVRGIDLGLEPGMLEAVARAEQPGGVSSTPFAARRDGTSGLFLVAESPNVIDGALHPGAVVVFVSEQTLRAAARNPVGLEFVAAGSSANRRTAANTVRQEFAVAGRRFAVVMPKASVTGAGAVLPWLILAAGLVLAGLTGALGVHATRRASAQAELDRIFNLSADLIVVADFEGRFTRVNPAVEQVLGYTEEEILNRPYLDFVHPEDRDRTAAEAAALGEGRATLSFENRYRRKDGSYRVLEWTSKPVVDDGVMYAVGRDVTDRRQSEVEQAALRRVATLVAQDVPPHVVFSAVSDEIGRLFDTTIAGVTRFDDGPSVVFVGVSKHVEAVIPIGTRWRLDDALASGQVYRTGRSARADVADWSAVSGPVAPAGIHLGTRSTVASPIVVEGRLWGTATVSASEPLPADADVRLQKFAELLATAIANAEAKSELAASRRRIVAASDDARRRIERDLHDGVQQQLVSLGLELRAMQADPPTGDALKEQLAAVTENLGSVLDALLETARGIHPAILSHGGLTAAVNALARRSPVPVELDAHIDARLPSDVEVGAYYVASEALTNVAKYAHASAVHVDMTTADGTLTLAVRDDGVGGADPGGGSGLVGLQDRVEALGGTITIDSIAGRGTFIVVTLPIPAEPDQEIGTVGPQREPESEPSSA